MSLSMRGRPIRSVAVAAAAVSMMAVGCSDEQSDPPPSTEPTMPTPAARTVGEACDDDVGDLTTEVDELSGSLTEPAGIDLVRAEADFDGGDLVVRFDTVGAIDEVADPMFSVFQGPPAQSFSWELQVLREGESWDVTMITYEASGRALAMARPRTLDVPVTVDGASLELTIPEAEVPPAVTLVWAFGSAATLEDGTRVFDACDNFDE